MKPLPELTAEMVEEQFGIDRADSSGVFSADKDAYGAHCAALLSKPLHYQFAVAIAAFLATTGDPIGAAIVYYSMGLQQGYRIAQRMAEAEALREMETR